MAKGRHTGRAARTRWPLIVGLAAGVLVLALGGVAYAAYRYEQANAAHILPGISIAGVDVSEMTRAEAIEAVRARAREDLDREIVVFVKGERFTTTPRRLGRRAWVGRAVERSDGGVGAAWPGSNARGGGSRTTRSMSTSSSHSRATAACSGSSAEPRGRSPSTRATHPSVSGTTEGWPSMSPKRGRRSTCAAPSGS